MPEQLIFTSKPTGIQPGRSGFQVVAQHNSINHRLVAALEKESIYEFADSSHSLPTICKFQKFEFGDERYAVLTRMQAYGVDFTGRPNHIAHHVIFSEKEIPPCPPAAVFALWKGWRQKWETKARYLGGWDRVNYENETEPFHFTKFALPAKTWKAHVGDEGAAAIPVLNDCEHLLFPFPEGKEDSLIWLFLESQSLLPVEKTWDITFTSYRIENDNLSRFKWIGYPKQIGGTTISLDADEIDIFDGKDSLVIPDGALAEKARKSSDLPTFPPVRKPGSAISIALIEDTGPIQDELGLEEDEKKPVQKESELLDSTLTSNIPDKYGDEVFGDIFTPDSNKDSAGLSDMDFPDENSIPLQEQSFLKRFRVPIILLTLLLVAIAAILLAPGLIELFNQKADPTPVVENTGPSVDEQQQKERLATAEMDPDSRFATQIGEVEAIINNGEFFLARAYLSKFREDPDRSDSTEFIELNEWFKNQRNLLEKVNREMGVLADRVTKRIVLPEFDQKTDQLESDINGLAKDLQPTLTHALDELEKDYSVWLNKVRLKTENVPTFFIPISRSQANPNITFSDLPEPVKDWFSGLDQFPVTSQIEHIQIQVSPFKGLNQFELSSEDAVDLSLWKQSERSLISYLDGQTEVIEIISDPTDLSKISFHWRFDGSNTSTRRFPEPPIILHFLNTLTNQALNVVMIGGISHTMTTPAEVPYSFLKLEKENYKFQILDPVLNEKLDLFILPPKRFLRLRSLDNRYLFARDETTNAFHLYESKNLESLDVKEIQNQISQQHGFLNQLERQQTIYTSVDFIKKTTLWSLGKEILPAGNCPAELANFGLFFENQNKNYFEYLRAILSHFASEYTLIRPSVMEKWVAYPKDSVPQTKDAVITYRSMLLRTSKRLRSLLKQDDPNSLEHWRNFVTNFEFWLMGSEEDQLVDVLSLSAEDIGIAKDTKIKEVEARLISVKRKIDQLQESLQDSGDLPKISGIDRWMLDMSSMENDTHATPLILFR